MGKRFEKEEKNDGGKSIKNAENGGGDCFSGIIFGRGNGAANEARPFMFGGGGDHHDAMNVVDEGRLIFRHVLTEAIIDRQSELPPDIVEEVVRSGTSTPAETPVQPVPVEEDGAVGGEPAEENMSVDTIMQTLLDTPEGSTYGNIGRQLRLISDRIAHLPERQDIRRHANDVNLDCVSRDDFLRMLTEIFPDNNNVTERIIVLFCFCADVAVNALKRGVRTLFAKFVKWSIEFIKNKVCVWVAAHGGWGTVLQGSLNFIYRCVGYGLAGLIAIGIAYGLKRMLDSPPPP